MAGPTVKNSLLNGVHRHKQTEMRPKSKQHLSNFHPLRDQNIYGLRSESYLKGFQSTDLILSITVRHYLRVLATNGSGERENAREFGNFPLSIPKSERREWRNRGNMRELRSSYISMDGRTKLPDG